MRLLWLPSVLRAAGLTVHEVSGWRERGSSSWGPIVGLTCHHTAGSRSSTDAGEIGVLVNGRPDLPPPIAQLYLSRTGHWHVVASGRANHNLVGWAGPNEGYGNSQLIGVEAQHSGGDEPWTDIQYQSYVRGVAAIARHVGFSANRVAGHKEHQPGAKTDPSFSMTRFRTDVATAMAHPSDDPLEDDMPTVPEIVNGLLTANVGASGPNVGRHLEETRDTVVTIPAKLDALLTAVLQVDEETVAKLGAADQPPEQVAAILRQLPGVAGREAQIAAALAGLAAE
jgi:hypothetical protein